MAKKYIYKNIHDRPINIGGYRFDKEQKLESDVLILGFNEAVDNGFLELEEVDSNAGEPVVENETTDTLKKIKIIFHFGIGAAGDVETKEVMLNPNEAIEFPDPDVQEGEVFNGWFRDKECTKAVDTAKIKSPKKGEMHLYASYSEAPTDPKGKETTDGNE
jgi:hypothetical protein